MNGLRILDIIKFTYKAIATKYEQSKLTTSIREIVNTSKGPVCGVKRLTIWGDSYYSFERIPYAKPPTGGLRFKAPVPSDPWDEALDCSTCAEKPLQANMLFKKYKGSEDCLYLNVFTRNMNPDKLRPVMVWIYGGGFQIGEASRDMYSPDYFMSKDVVLVTIAYRLGPFGFLSMNEPGFNVPGNAGLKDQILSLKWVQENIKAFGGDPNNVTLFGESAGGASTHLCMLSEQSKGLVHKAIVMSGSALCPWARPPPDDFAFRLAKILGYQGENIGLNVYHHLMGAKGPDIVKACSGVLSKEEKHNRVLFAFGPVVEPYETESCVVPREPYEMMMSTWSNQIPMMIGGTSFEGLLFHPEVTRRPATLNEVGECKNLLPLDLPVPKESPLRDDYARKLKAAYFGSTECSEQTKFQFLDLESYREFWHPIYRTVLSRLRHSAAPTYLYRFDFDSPDGNAIRNLLCGSGVRGACHGDDLCYLYYAIFSYRAPIDSPEYRVTKTMIDTWTSFAESNDPNCQYLEGVKFEPVAKGEPIKCLNIREKCEFVELPELEKLKLWDSFYPMGRL